LTTRGAPERWEAETLFSETRLEEALESADSDAQAEELRQLFLERRIETGRFVPHPDPWDCLLGSLAIGQGDWDSLRTTDGADVVRGAQGTKVGWLAMALVVGGFGLCSVSAAMRLPELGAGGFVASWVGLTIQLRRSSMVVAVGGGLLGACVLFLLGAAAGGVFHSLIR
jgi:hypothetical protein